MNMPETERSKRFCAHPKAQLLRDRGLELFYMISPSSGPEEEWTIIAKSNDETVAGSTAMDLTECLNKLENDLKRSLWDLCSR